jgi:hypothetical protein
MKKSHLALLLVGCLALGGTVLSCKDSGPASKGDTTAVVDTLKKDTVKVDTTKKDTVKVDTAKKVDTTKTKVSKKKHK